MAKVVVGLSGGVDSSVAAHILKEQGHEVVAIFMRNWKDESVILHNECPWIEDSNDAMMVAESLEIPFHVIDLSEEYKERIVDYMFSEYQAGRTPNPDVLCNREIKFDVFLEAAMKLGAEYVATGHYCRRDTQIIKGKEIHRLLSGVDRNKDQSYFLCQLNQHQLSKALFPIGELTKPEVRKIATELDLVTADKKDSQGLCFIGKVSLPDFLQQKLEPKTGNIVEIPFDFQGYDRKRETLEEFSQDFRYVESDGKIVGTHRGAHYFTIGQRKGLQVGGSPKPLFVISTDVNTNSIYVGQGDDHPGLFKKALFIKSDEVHWIREDLKMSSGEEKEFMVRIRYRQPLQKAKLIMRGNGLYIEFEEPQRAVAAGQFAAWYLNEELIGSGIIG